MAVLRAQPLSSGSLSSVSLAAAALYWTPERIRALRKSLGYTQAQMATALGLSRIASVSDLEKGKAEVNAPTTRLLYHIEAHGDVPQDRGAST